MKRNKIIVEESRINPKKMIVAKYRNRNKFINREEIEGLKLKDERNYEVEESEKSPEYEEKANKLEITYKQKIEKTEVKKLENRQEIHQDIEEVNVEEEVKEEVEIELNEEIYEVEEEKEINEEIYEVQEVRAIKQEVEEIDNKIKLQEYIEENNIAEKERYETSCNLSLEYSGQIYKDRRIIFDPPKNDKIVSITNINRDMYVNDIEILENGVNIKAAISVSINYGTSKDIFKQEEKCKENKEQNSIILESDIKEVILTDGVVRDTTVLIPCEIYINIPEANCFDKLRVVRGNLRTTNTQYILDNGDLTNAIIPIGHSLKGMMERYILSIEVEVI